MKRIVLFACAALLSAATFAQVQTPAPSTPQKIVQTVGLTEVTLEYSRPSMKGRTIYGDLVPYGELWRTGANANTKITFGDDVMVGGKTLKAGSYALYSKPNKENWEVMFYSDATNWGTPREWDASKVAATVTVPVYPMSMPVETFTMTFDDVKNDSKDTFYNFLKDF